MKTVSLEGWGWGGGFIKYVLVLHIFRSNKRINTKFKFRVDKVKIVKSKFLVVMANNLFFRFPEFFFYLCTHVHTHTFSTCFLYLLYT